MINGHPVKAIHNPGCVGVAASKWFAKKQCLGQEKMLPITISLLDATTTIKRRVYEKLVIEWEEKK